MAVHRHCAKDTWLGDKLIRKGTMVYPVYWSMMVDPAAWGDDPLAFRPERHLVEDTRDRMMVFGTGQR